MKRIKSAFIFLLFSFILSPASAQAPSGFNYQAALRDNAGSPVVNRSISVQVSILQGSETWGWTNRVCCL